ncbi:PqqD family protein [Streptomyces sp. NPDC093510]|uniref:PqqD family protein n=1 Tax=Streptomyces sp. NPDC093510 TaxID=3155199 RepID=UPI0034278493
MTSGEEMNQPSPGPDSVPKMPLDLRIRRTKDSLLLMYGESLMELSESAAFIVREFEGRSSLADIARRLVDAYGIPFDEALEDVTSVAESLQSHAMVDYA